MICRHCGKEFYYAGQFCPFCGKPLSGNGRTDKSDQDTAKDGKGGGTFSGSNTKMPWSPLIKGILSVAALFIISLAVILLWPGKNNVRSLKIIPASGEVSAGETLSMNAEILPANADNKNVIWTLEDHYDSENSIYRASIDPRTGVLTANSAGRVTIVATSEDGGISDSCTLIIRFRDVSDPSSFWYEPVYWASGKGITYGIQDHSTKFFQAFGEERQCTRAQTVTFLWRMVGSPEPTGTEKTFSDVNDSSAYYYKAVQWAVNAGITEGYKDGTFRPQDKCLRRQAVMFLWRLAGKPEPKGNGTSFSDVPEKVKNSSGKLVDNIWYDPIMWASENGITQGYTSGAKAGTFQAGGDCLRRQMVTFLWRFDNKFGPYYWDITSGI